MHEPDAVLLASHGYAVLALASFSMDGVPTEPVDIPLKYLAAAIDWLRAQAGVRGDRLGVIGGSPGGELALLLGAAFPAVTAVVSYAGPHSRVFSLRRPSGLGFEKRPAVSSDLPWQLC